MKYKEFGNNNKPSMVLLHGGGLSYWSLNNIVRNLEKSFYVITPVIDGHGEDGETEFSSIEDSAQKLLHYIDEKLNGKVFAIAGLSLGAQIVVEILSQRKNIADYAVIESALVIPTKSINFLIKPLYNIFYGLIKQKWFSRLQAKSLFVPKNEFGRYYNDSLMISRQSLINIAQSNGNYVIKDTLKNTQAKVLIIVGSKEINFMRKSAKILHDKLIDSQLYIANGMQHGEISLIYYDKYLALIKSFMKIKPSY